MGYSLPFKHGKAYDRKYENVPSLVNKPTFLWNLVFLHIMFDIT